MSDPYMRRFEQDRALRDAAKDLVQQDLDFLRGNNAERGVGGRIADRARSGASNLAGEATDYASDNRGTVAAGVALAGAALALAIFRRPLLEAIGDLIGLNDQAEIEGQEPEGAELHSDSDAGIQGDVR